jgi:uncharacterized membrane-anchored protein YitT (DUF2179 family)
MKKFTLYLGLNDKDSKIQKIDTLEAYKICTNILLKYTEGATIYSAQGIYKHDDDSFVVENTLRIELLFVERESVLKIIEILKLAFNQESVALQVENINSELI